ncbi:hypothetical protein BJY04DRAFT_220733 [Aspergillus karnatakaensis]|uniref:E3 ubiquitin-protein ligase RNF216 n=1 Tax=Aspergillus karnatakaensis TaxID=1810916 RepID=UPI003CCE005E
MDYPILISSDDDDDEYPFLEDYAQLELNGAWPNVHGGGNFRNGSMDRPSKRPRVRGPELSLNDELAFSLLASLDPNSSQTAQETAFVASAAEVTDPLLLQVLEIFPDISHKYVKDLIARHRLALLGNTDLQPNNLDIAVSADAIYEEILGQKTYPKQEVDKGKRKRESSEEARPDWEEDRTHKTHSYVYSEAAAAVLANEFLTIPMQHIKKVLREKKRLHPAFLALQADVEFSGRTRKSYHALKKNRVATPPKNNFVLGDILTRELTAAKTHTQKLQSKISKEKEEEEAERANEEEHTRTGNLIECQCCYSDVPANRSIPCEGADLHLFCFSCIRRSAETQIGMMKYTLQCFDVSGCQASFARPQLREVLGASIMDKLDALQQEDEIQKAALEGLEDCPFCSYKAILPPVEEDKEFRCENPECKQVSCRLCKEESHIPMTCEEARKEKGLSERHEVEEAMSKALIRTCPRCQVKIVKEYGCNNMHCSKCGASMCYICQKDITKQGYDHFRRGGCAQDDAMARERERKEIQEAQKAAIEGILARNPDISEEELQVELPKAQATANAHQANRFMYARAPQNPMGEALQVLFHQAAPMGYPPHANNPGLAVPYPNNLMFPPQPQIPEDNVMQGYTGFHHPAFGAPPRPNPPAPAAPARGVRVAAQVQRRNPAPVLQDFQVMNATPGYFQPPQQGLGGFAGQRANNDLNAYGNARARHDTWW